MSRKNRRWTGWVSEITSLSSRFQEMYPSFKRNIKNIPQMNNAKTRRCLACTRLDLESLGSWQSMYSQKLPGQCLENTRISTTDCVQESARTHSGCCRSRRNYYEYPFDFNTTHHPWTHFMSGNDRDCAASRILYRYTRLGNFTIIRNYVQYSLHHQPSGTERERGIVEPPETGSNNERTHWSDCWNLLSPHEMNRMEYIRSWLWSRGWPSWVSMSC